MIDSIHRNFPQSWLALRLGIAVVSLSTASLLIRFCQAPSLAISIYRLATAFICIAPFALLRTHQMGTIRIPRSTIPIISLSALCLSLHFWLWISSIESTSITKSTVLVTTSPIFVTLINWIIRKQQPSRSMLMAIWLATTGTLILVYDESVFQGISRGDGLAILAAVCMAGYLTAGYQALKTIPARVYIPTVYLISSIILLVLALSLKVNLTGFDSQTYVLLGLIGLIPQLIGHSLINALLRHLQPGNIAIAILGEPLGATVLAWIFLSEVPTYVAMLGGAIILCSIVFVIRLSEPTHT